MKRYQKIWKDGQRTSAEKKAEEDRAAMEASGKSVEEIPELLK